MWGAGRARDERGTRGSTRVQELDDDRNNMNIVLGTALPTLLTCL